MQCKPSILRWLIVPAFSVLAACQTAASPDPVETSFAEAYPAANCEPPKPYGGYLLWAENPSVPPSSTVRLTPWYSAQPGVMEPVPNGCLQIDEVEGPGKLSADGAAVQVGADAASGANVFVRGHVGNSKISGRIIVYEPAVLPLVGRWSQREGECMGAEPLRELVFNGDGTFTVTWAPFEVYKDYWGTYTFDAETGRLVLVPEGGNHVPTDAGLNGVALLDPEGLDPGAGFFGSPMQGKSCSAPFRR